MSHPVLTDPSISVPVTIQMFTGTRFETRGVVSTLDETAATVMAEFTGAGRQVWVSGRYEPEEVEFVDINGRRYRALGGATLAGNGWQSTRLALRDA